ncbi:GlsB/YeaQ/YmgE family stress response membrane protein [Dietzia sp. CH92]|uniref:GlsB/YeaQ/YmgE family stress response membrane protein n=1 Tax=Dietzia sp. CH92 TaxID=3051823 RepID=UPI0028D32196|nr:GlsB/YeaQ/YmgE family stress response membrane protein [Dietzia sp. CH92]
MLWSIISWIIVGGLAGWIASMIMGRNAQMGFVANVLAGVVGAFVVGLIVSFLTSDGGGMPEAFSLWGFIAAIIGACLLIWVVSLVRGRGRSRV